jgi:hypothetical protein
MVSLSDLLPDEWYISIICNCGARLILFRDLTQGKGTLKGAFSITCPVCGTSGCYPAQHYKYKPEIEASENAFSRAS